MMRKAVVMMAMIFCAGAVSAQEVIDFSPEKGLLDSVLVAPLLTPSVGGGKDTLSLPPLNYRGSVAFCPSYGSFFSGYADWALHRGLNASLSASAIFGLGHNSGSGFANSLAVMYADNLTPKLSFALGGYSSFLEYGGRQMKDAGLNAMLSYRFDEHWEASVFAQKSVVQPRIPPQLYWMHEDIGDKIGASVRYNFNPSFSVSVSVWNQKQPSPYFVPRP